MLSKLYIENIAVIERAEIDFSKGFNVLTGETGAGKSILVDSINAVLGQRTSRELIRTGADRAFVCAEFEDVSPAALQELSELGYEPAPEDGNSVSLRREIRADGKNAVRINNRPGSISDLRAVGRLLINIHGQHENQALMSVDRHMKYLDSMGGRRQVLQRLVGRQEGQGQVKLILFPLLFYCVGDIILISDHDRTEMILCAVSLSGR